MPKPNKYPIKNDSFFECSFNTFNKTEMDKIDKNQRSKGAKPNEKTKPHNTAKNLFLFIMIIVKTESILRKKF